MNERVEEELRREAHGVVDEAAPFLGLVGVDLDDSRVTGMLVCLREIVAWAMVQAIAAPSSV